MDITSIFCVFFNARINKLKISWNNHKIKSELKCDKSIRNFLDNISEVFM